MLSNGLSNELMRSFSLRCHLALIRLSVLSVATKECVNDESSYFVRELSLLLMDTHYCLSFFYMTFFWTDS